MTQDLDARESDDNDTVTVDRIWFELYVLCKAICWLSWITVIATSAACFYTFFEARPGHAFVIGLAGLGILVLCRLVKIACEFMWAVAYWAGETYELLAAEKLGNHGIS